LPRDPFYQINSDSSEEAPQSLSQFA